MVWLGPAPEPAAAVVEYGYRVVASYPHSTDIFTQGLAFRDGVVYEGAGKRGQSMVLIRRLESLEPVRRARLEPNLFGEGITILGQRLYQLTWQSQRVLVYDATDLRRIREFSIRGEGWGIATDGRRLIMSDGSNRLVFLDPETFSMIDQVEVELDGRPVSNLNELEWIDGLVYANVWRSDRIVMIDPATGDVVGVADLGGLLPDALRTTETDVLNGIAYDSDQKRLLVTGKHWPRLYHIVLVPKRR